MANNPILVPREFPIEFPIGKPPAVYAVYGNPSDYPGKFVVRVWDPTPAPEPLVVADDLEAARAAIKGVAPLAVHFERHPLDDVAIVETWL